MTARIWLGVAFAAGWIALAALAQNPQEPQSGGDPEVEAPPTKAYREAVRIRGVGVKVGEVTANSAIVWARVPPPDEIAYRRKRDLIEWLASLFVEEDIQVRFRYGPREDLSGVSWTYWADADVEDDFTERWELSGLQPATTYYFEVEGADEDRRRLYEVRRGRFRTAPPNDAETPVTFTVVTGQRYDRLDHPEGFEIYPSMRALNPDFAVLTGDTVYFDRGPLKARTLHLARDRWRRVYELPRLFEFHAEVPAYWEKDDHDVLADDAGPSSKPFGEITFESGVELFKKHTPVGDIPYRRFRWGRLLEIWLTEVREFRDPNRAPDGPGKSIYGERQKQWLKDTLSASDAAWRVLINPTPIVGPDRARFKYDNHSNNAWKHEGDELRQWFAEALGENFFIVAGDRHWQYHSLDPATGVAEYACGPASDAHAGGSPGFDAQYHRYHRVGGGFLSVSVGSEDGVDYALVRLHDVQGNVAYEERKTRSTD